MTSRLSHRHVLSSLRTSRDEMPTTTARARILRVAGSMLVSNGLTVVPTLIWAWGATLYGEWLILYTIPGYLTLSDFGIIATANNRIDAQCARGQFGAANRTYFNSVLLLAGLLAAIAASAVAVGATLGEQFTALFVTLTPMDVAVVAAVLFADSMVLLVFNHHSALYRTLGRFNWTVNWQAVGRVVPIIALIVVALSGADIFIAALVMLGFRCVLLGAMAIDLWGRIKWLRRDWMRSSRLETVRLVRGALGFMTLPLSNMLYLHVTTLIVAAVSSPIAVAAFATLRTFTRMIPQIVSISGRARWSEIAQAEARGEHDAVRAMRSLVLRHTLGLSALAVAGYLTFGEVFYGLWTGGNLPFDRLLFWAFLANAVAIALYTALEVFLLSVNRVGKYATVFLILTVTQLVAGWLLIPHFGLTIFPILGALAGVLISGYLITDSLLRRSGEVKRGSHD